MRYVILVLLAAGCALETGGLGIPSDAPGDPLSVYVADSGMPPDAAIADSDTPDAPLPDSGALTDSGAYEDASEGDEDASPDAASPWPDAAVTDSGMADAAGDTSEPPDPCAWDVMGECTPCVGSIGCGCNLACTVTPIDRAAICPPECAGGCRGVWTYIGSGLVQCLRE